MAARRRSQSPATTGHVPPGSSPDVWSRGYPSPSVGSPATFATGALPGLQGFFRGAATVDHVPHMPTLDVRFRDMWDPRHGDSDEHNNRPHDPQATGTLDLARKMLAAQAARPQPQPPPLPPGARWVPRSNGHVDLTRGTRVSGSELDSPVVDAPNTPQYPAGDAIIVDSRRSQHSSR